MAKVVLYDEDISDKYPHLHKHDSKLGKQSMEQIVNLHLYNLSHQFVNEYLEYGKEYALLWILNKASAEERVEMKGYVQLAFDKAGYSVN